MSLGEEKVKLRSVEVGESYSVSEIAYSGEINFVSEIRLRRDEDLFPPCFATLTASLRKRYLEEQGIFF